MSAARDPYEQGLAHSAEGRHMQAIERFEEALGQRPDDTRILFALGNTARHLGLPEAAEQFFRRVLAAEPDRIEALVNLANLLRAQGAFEAASALIAPALARYPEQSELWLTQGSICRETGDGPRAAEHYRAALAQRCDYAPALSNLADLLADEGEIEEALALYNRALKADPGNAQAQLNRAMLHLGHGSLKDGWRDYAARLTLANKVPVPEHRLPRWSGGSLKRTRLMVTGEQGIGDQIMFASLIPELASRAAAEGGSILLECEGRLADLFARSFPQVTVRPWDVETKAGGETVARYGWLKGAGGANAAIEIGSLPRYLRGTVGAFPNPHAYLTPDLGEWVVWQGVLAATGPAPLIGICWRSGKAGGHRALQYAPLEAWAGFIAGLPGTLVSVQYDAREEEIAALEKLSGRKIFVPPSLDQKNEIDRTAAMLASLDAVVSAPTAVSWLAASAGIPTVKILYDTSWTCFGEAYEPFAPSCRCAMPDRRGDWTHTFSKAREILTTQI